MLAKPRTATHFANNLLMYTYPLGLIRHTTCRWQTLVVVVLVLGAGATSTPKLGPADRRRSDGQARSLDGSREVGQLGAASSPFRTSSGLLLGSDAGLIPGPRLVLAYDTTRTLVSTIQRHGFDIFVNGWIVVPRVHPGKRGPGVSLRDPDGWGSRCSRLASIRYR